MLVNRPQINELLRVGEDVLLDSLIENYAGERAFGTRAGELPVVVPKMTQKEEISYSDAMRPIQEGNSRVGDVDVDPALRIVLVRALRLEEELVEFGKVSCEHPVGRMRKPRSQSCVETEPADERDVRHAQPLVPVPIPNIALRLRARHRHPGALEPHIVRTIWF